MADANNHGGLVMCKCEQFLFRLLTKPCLIARGFLGFLPTASNRRKPQRGWGDKACGLRRDGALGRLQGSVDNAAAETDIPVIEHRGLARSDRRPRVISAFGRSDAPLAPVWGKPGLHTFFNSPSPAGGWRGSSNASRPVFRSRAREPEEVGS